MAGKKDMSDLIHILYFSGHLLTAKRFRIFVRLFQQARALYIPLLEPFALYAVALGGIEGLYKYAFFSIAGILMSQHAIYFLTRENEMLFIIDKLKKNIARRQKPWHQEFFLRESTPLWKVINLYLVTCIIFMVFHSLAPFPFDFYLALFTDKKPFSLPTPAEPYMGKDPQRSLSYYIIYFMGSIWSAFLTLHSIGTEIMTYVFTTYVCVELQIIKRNIEEYGEKLSNGWNDNSKIALKQIINDHKNIMILAKDVNNLLGAPMVFQNVISTMTWTLLMYTASINVRTGNYPVAIGAMFPLNCFIFMIFAICYMGEKLNGNSLALSESLYELPWYEMDPQMRKDLLMMLRQASKPLVLDYKCSSLITLATFMKMINESYSYLMVLQSLN